MTDTPPKSAVTYIKDLQDFLATEQYGQIGTVTGRYYAMDRDKRWERIQLAYEGLVKGVGENTTPSELLSTVQRRYEANETDEFLKPIIVDEKGIIQDGDVLVFIDFRADRMREIVETLGEVPPFDTDVERDNLHVVQFTQYKSTFDMPIVFPPQSMDNTLAVHLSNLGLKQFHTAETEKYAVRVMMGVVLL